MLEANVAKAVALALEMEDDADVQDLILSVIAISKSDSLEETTLHYSKALDSLQAMTISSYKEVVKNMRYESSQLTREGRVRAQGGL